MIEIKNLVKKYQRDEVLNIINLTIKDEEKVAIMGLNGSGKTTLGEIIIGSKQKTSGNINFTNCLWRKNAVFQESSYDAEMPIYEIAKFYQQIFKSDSNLDALFTQFELWAVKKARFRKLSGGQKQKFKFLVATINKPNLLLLDELTTSLDYLWKNKIIALIKEEMINNKATVLLISHDINEVSQLCNRVLLLEKGMIVKDILLTNNEQQNVQILKTLIN